MDRRAFLRSLLGGAMLAVAPIAPLVSYGRLLDKVEVDSVGAFVEDDLADAWEKAWSSMSIGETRAFVLHPRVVDQLGLEGTMELLD